MIGNDTNDDGAMHRWIYSRNMGTHPDHEGPLAEDLPLMEKSMRDADMKGPLRALELYEIDADWLAGEGPSLGLNGIYEQPGWSDTRYASKIIAHYEDYQEHVAEITAVCQALAQRYGVLFHYAALGELGWIAKQGESPEQTFTMVWQCRWWAADGVEHFERGELVIQVASIGAAFDETVKHVDDRIDAAAIIVECDVCDPVTHEWGGPRYPRQYLSYGAITHELRKGCRIEGKPSATLRKIRQNHPDLSTLDLMQNIAGTFEFKVRDLGHVEAWTSGKISDEQFDADFEPRIRVKEWKWDAVFRLQRRLLAGEPIAIALHEYCTLHETFGSIELEELVLDAFDYNHYNEEDRWTQQAYKTAITDWICRGYHAEDEQLEKALAPLKERLSRIAN